MELIHPCKNVLEKSSAHFCTWIGKACLIIALSKVWGLCFPWALTAAHCLIIYFACLLRWARASFCDLQPKGREALDTLEFPRRGGTVGAGIRAQWVIFLSLSFYPFAAFTEGGGRLLCGSGPTLTSCQPLSSLEGFPSGAGGEGPTCQHRRLKRCGFDPWVRKLSWRREWHPTPVFLPGKSHGQRSLAGYHPWSHKELDMAYHTHTVHLV